MSSHISDLIEIPVELPGKLFRSCMPFSSLDPSGSLIEKYQTQKISVIVLLVSDNECLNRTNLDLRNFYENNGFEVIQLEIGNFDVPDVEAMEQLVGSAYQRIVAGKNIVAHCFAGVGRAGVFLSSFVKKVQQCTGVEAIIYVRKYVAHAVQTHEQVEFINLVFDTSLPSKSK